MEPLTIDFSSRASDRGNARLIADRGLTRRDVNQALTLARILDEARRLRAAAQVAAQVGNDHASQTMEHHGSTIVRECERDLGRLGLDSGTSATDASRLVRGLVEASYMVTR